MNERKILNKTSLRVFVSSESIKYKRKIQNETIEGKKIEVVCHHIILCKKRQHLFHKRMEL